MSRFLAILLMALCFWLTSCTPWVLGDPPAPLPPLPAPLPPPAPVVAPPPEPEPAWQPILYVPPPAEPEPPPRSKGKGTLARKAPAEPTPQQVIEEANREARVPPTRRGYFGQRGEYRYLWSPGKIYDIYLTPTQGTKLVLPPGETLAHAVVLNPRSFDVNTATIGTEAATSTLIMIRPCATGEGTGEDKCVQATEVNVGLTSTSGRSYDVHLIVGKVGMVTVTWDITPVPHLQMEDSNIIPKRATP